MGDNADIEDTFLQLMSLVPMANDAGVLEEIATSIDIDITGVAGNVRRLTRLVLLQLNSDDFDNSPDRDNLIETNFDRLRIHLNVQPKADPDAAATAAPVQTDPTALAGNVQANPPAPVANAQANPATLANVQANPAAPAANIQINPPAQAAIGQGIPTAPVATTPQAAASTTTPVTCAATSSAGAPSVTTSSNFFPRSGFAKLKDFKIDGAIDSTDSSKRLTYTSLQHQVDSGLARGYPETEIIAAVIRCLPPGSSTRAYFEGRKNLTLPTVLTTLRAHFEENKVTTMYEELTKKVQLESDKPLKFLMDCLTLRDQILDLEQEQVASARYGRPLLQTVMLDSLFIGFRDEGIRQHLRPYLQDKDVSDDTLIDEVKKATSAKKARDVRFGGGDATNTTANVSMLGGHASSDSSGSTPSDRDSQFLSQLKDLIGKELKSQVGPLKTELNNLRQHVNSVNAKQKPSQAVNVASLQGQAQPDGSGSAPPPGPSASAAQSPAPASSEEFLTQLFSHFQAMGGVNNRSFGGGSRGGRGRGRGGGGMFYAKCSMCRNANAVRCNHCMICHAVTHRNIDCPKKDDPNWTPLN